MRYRIYAERSGEHATVEASDIADTIGPWFPEAPAQVSEAIRDLQKRAMRNQFLGDLETFLGLRVDRADDA